MPKRRHYEGEYDPARLMRGAARKVDRMGPNQFRVVGNEEPFYDVDLNDCEAPCQCIDAQMHGRGCLHELAARLHAGDGPLIMSLGLMLLKKAEREERAAKKSKRPPSARHLQGEVRK